MTTTGTTAIGFGTKGKSGNSKLTGTGRRRLKVFATYRPVGVTCPASCALMNTGIVNKRHGTLREVDGGAAYREAIRKTHADRPDLLGWTYTHGWMHPEVVAWRDTLPTSVGVVASCDRIEDARRAVDLGWRAVSVVVPTADGEHFTAQEAKDTRRTIREAIPSADVALPCPAQLAHAPDVGCGDCMACHRAPHAARVTVIVFAAHSAARRAACDTDTEGGCYAQQGRVGKFEIRAATERTDFYQWGSALPAGSGVRWSVSGGLWTDSAPSNPRLPVLS